MVYILVGNVDLVWDLINAYIIVWHQRLYLEERTDTYNM